MPKNITIKTAENQLGNTWSKQGMKKVRKLMSNQTIYIAPNKADEIHSKAPPPDISHNGKVKRNDIYNGLQCI